MPDEWRGVIISESLQEPSLINEFQVYGARISQSEQRIDDEGNVGRWHLYWVVSNLEQIDALLTGLHKRWYAHFWRGDRIIAVFSGRKFEFSAEDKSTWKEATAYGRSQGIPEEQLDFPTVGTGNLD